MRYLYTLPAVAIIAACAAIDTTPSRITPSLPPVGTDSCGARDHARFVGQPVTALERELILKPVRIIRPNTAVTMDYLERRVNFYVDDTDRVEAISCG